MNRLQLSRALSVGTLITLAVGWGIAGCSSDSNKTPSNNDGGSGGEDAAGGEGGSSNVSSSSSTKGGSTSASGGAASEGGATSTAATTSAGGATSTSTSTVACTHDSSKNCYECPATAAVHFLNACNSSGTRPACSPYDNSKLTKLVNGKVPALP